jgi:hypothetical protein
MELGAAIWVGVALLVVLVIGVAVVLIRGSRRRAATELSRDEKLRRGQRAADQINRNRRKTAKGSLRRKGGGSNGVEDSIRAHDLGPNRGWDSGGSDSGGSDGGGSDGGGSY